MIPKIILKNCLKQYCRDLDKAIQPEETVRNVRKRLKNWPEDVLAGSQRIDTGRLGIPVYMCICGNAAKTIMPTRKQMGKGSSPAQAEASAIMELMERFAFFSFWNNMPFAVEATWSAARRKFGQTLLPVAEMLRSVNDSLTEPQAERLLDLMKWIFYPATDLATGQNVWIPLDWFRMLGEFNGSSAGNTNEESLLQGISELIERHVSCIVDRERPELATIAQDKIEDPVLHQLCRAFHKNGIQLILKDISLGMPLPTVAALAWDPSTFPDASEIVFTAGTASSPTKAAIRAVTEVAQLGGDFCTHSCYEASGLPKFTNLDDLQWLMVGPIVQLSSLPTVENVDIRNELMQVVQALAPLYTLAVEITHPGIGIPAHYTIIPGLQFRERDKNQSLGLFIGRKLAEKAEPEAATAGLAELAKIYPQAHYLLFFRGMLKLRQGNVGDAATLFAQAVPEQPDDEARALAAFYAGYALGQCERWQEAIPYLEQARELAPQMNEAANQLGVACFKMRNYARAESYFDIALAINKGSAIDLANRGLARKFLGKTAEARRDLTTALELDANLDFARKHLAQLEAE